MNKKGISDVVTTVLIILLSIVAVIILWAALRPTIASTAGRVGTAITCTDITLTVNSCIINGNASSSNVTFTREGGANDVIALAVVSDADSSNSANVTISPLATRTVFVSKTGISGTTSVAVATVLADGTMCTPTRAVCA